jgi:hypothetical protein
VLMVRSHSSLAVPVVNATALERIESPTGLSDYRSRALFQPVAGLTNLLNRSKHAGVVEATGRSCLVLSRERLMRPNSGQAQGRIAWSQRLRAM